MTLSVDSYKGNFDGLIDVYDLCHPNGKLSRYALRQYSDLFGDHIFLASREDSRISGFVIAGTCSPRHNVGWILSLGVAEQDRSSGIGTGLLKAAESSLFNAGANTCLLTVTLTNEPARHLFGKAGYHECDRNPSYYRDDVCKIVMERTLIE